MSQRSRKTNYWKDAPMPRDQLVLFPTTLQEIIPEDHPVRHDPQASQQPRHRIRNETFEREVLSQPVASEAIDKLPIRPQTKRFDKSAFVYDEENDVYYCPAGKRLEHRKTERTRKADDTTLRREIYTCQDCAGCPLAARCRKDPEASGGRNITVDEYEAARRRHRQRMSQPESQEAYARRQHAREHPFAVLKVRFDMRRFLLRGKEGVSQEWRWGYSGFNLLNLMSVWPMLRGTSCQTPA